MAARQSLRWCWRSGFDGVIPDASPTDNTGAVVDLGHRVENVLAAFIHIIIGSDRYRYRVALRADDMLERGEKLGGQIAMGH